MLIKMDERKGRYDFKEIPCFQANILQVKVVLKK